MASSDVVVSAVRALIDLKKLKINMIELYPVLYALFWMIILFLAWQKDGEYGAPQSLFYT